MADISEALTFIQQLQKPLAKAEEVLRAAQVAEQDASAGVTLAEKAEARLREAQAAYDTLRLQNEALAASTNAQMKDADAQLTALKEKAARDSRVALVTAQNDYVALIAKNQSQLDALIEQINAQQNELASVLKQTTTAQANLDAINEQLAKLRALVG